MKAKTINAILCQKFDSWIASIEDKTVREMANRRSIITGGCIASMLLKEKVNDFDVYFTDADTAKAVATYYAGKFKHKNKKGIECPIFVQDGWDIRGERRIKIVVQSAGIAEGTGTETPKYDYFESLAPVAAGEYVQQTMAILGAQAATDAMEDIQNGVEEADNLPPYRPVFLSTNAITLSGRMQLILRFQGEPNVLHGNYDFVHCTNYWHSRDRKLTLRPDALECLLTKELRYFGSRYPICSIIRLRKFIGRGWTINAGQILKMAMQISQLDLNKVEVLEDQLTGVDVMYFMQLISAMKEKDVQQVDYAYLVEIIDRMF